MVTGSALGEAGRWDVGREAFSGAAETVGAKLPREVRFEVLVDDHSVISATRGWWPGTTSAERQWQPLPTTLVPPGSEQLPCTVLVNADESEPAPVGFGRPRLLQRVLRQIGYIGDDE